MDNRKHLYWAFQSTQIEEPSSEKLERFQNKYKKDFETREVYVGEELEEKYKLNSWRNPMFSKIIGVVLGYEHKGTLRVKYIFGEEKDVLISFVNLLTNKFQDYQLCHYDSEIVLPYLNVRLNSNGFFKEPHQDLKYRKLRPWDLTAFDIKQFYKGAGNYSFSLKDITHILNIDSSKVIDVEDEFLYYNLDGEEELKNSAIQQVEVLSKIYNTLNNLPILDTVLIKERVEDVEIEEPKNWLEVLYRENKLTEEVKNGIKSNIKGKKMLVRDKKNLRTILLGAYIHCNFEQKDQDYGDTIKAKELEVDNFLNTL